MCSLSLRYIQATVAALLLIILPLLVAWRRHSRVLPCRWSTGGYFLALGLAFLFVEISSMQRFILFLGHPLYAIAVVLSGFLMFAGLGSGCGATLRAVFPSSPRHVSSRWRWAASQSHAALPLAVAASFCLGEPAVHCHQDPAHAGPRRPPGVLYGPAISLGLAQIAAHMPEMVPWVWGINGCASVVSVMLATLLAMLWGFTAVTLLAVALYGLAAVIWGRIDRHALRPPRMRTKSYDNL